MMVNILYDGENYIIWFGDMYTVKFLLEVHAFIVMLSLYEECNCRSLLHCFGEECNWRCTLGWCGISVKLSLNPKLGTTCM